MTRIIFFLAACQLAFVTNAQVIDMRNIDEFNAKLAEKRQMQGIPETNIDQKKFDAAADRREKRRDDALEERRKRNANKSHVYSLTKTFPVPFHLRPYRSPSVAIPRVDKFRRRATQFVSRIAPPMMVPSLLAAQQNQRLPRVLFLVDEGRTAMDPKPSALRASNFLVFTPELPEDDFRASIRVAELACDQYQPDIIVGDSRGAAVALNLDTGDTPLVLLSPAWKQWGAASTVKQNATLIHSRSDRVVPYSDSELLIANSDLRDATIIQTGSDHRLVDPQSLRVLVQACQSLVP